MTGLEALNKFVNIFAEYCVKTQHQEMNAINMQTAVEYLARSEECRTIGKSLKALEIIKEKNVDIITLKKSNTLKDYIKSATIRNLFEKGVLIEELTEEEFNTLKAVLE